MGLPLPIGLWPLESGLFSVIPLAGVNGFGLEVGPSGPLGLLGRAKGSIARVRARLRLKPGLWPRGHKL